MKKACLIGIGMLMVGFVCTGIMTGYVAADGDDTKTDATTLCIPVDDFEISPPQGVEQQRSAILFPHAKHFSFKCQECHHKWDAGAELKNCTVSGCHDSITPPKNPLKKGEYTKDAMKYYKYAYHELCRGCHKDMKADQLSTGPIGCIDCHPK